MNKYFIFCLLIISNICFAQNEAVKGIISGNLVDIATSKPMLEANVSLVNIADETTVASQVTAKEGSFYFNNILPGYYRLGFSATGYASFSIDSIHIRKERSDFNLSDIKMSVLAAGLANVVVYAEKPLYENKDGKITFNAGESALSAGSTTTELLKQTPLITVDEDGKVLLKGKEVKILIDDKPVEMDARQLQDMLESMPGSMIEKIEVLTTAPPQFASERGGVINIVTKKGKAGNTARLNVNYGSRGEAAVNGSYNVRKKKLSLNASAGFAYSQNNGSSCSTRQNFYTDSSNFFRTNGSSENNGRRPSGRLNLDYELNKQQQLNATIQYNANINDGAGSAWYRNYNRFDELHKLSNRATVSQLNAANISTSMAYTWKAKRVGKVLRVNGNFNNSAGSSNRDFFQQFLTADSSLAGSDSSQQQNNQTASQRYIIAMNYDRPLKNKKFLLNTGIGANYGRTHNDLLSAYLRKTDSLFVNNELLSNDFIFYERNTHARLALRYEFKQGFFATAGLQQEYCITNFDIKHDSGYYKNRYYSTLPFINVSGKWESGYAATFSYKRSIQRPGIQQLNPSVDYTDPYNLRFGNPFLQPYYSDNFDLMLGYWTKKFNVNFSTGYNALQQIYNSVRTLQAEGKTQTTWQNIGGRREYEASIWGGFSPVKKLKLNVSGRYVYNEFGLESRLLYRYKNAGSVTASLSGNYQWNKLLNISSNVAYNRLANPQGRVRTIFAVNMGVQQKFLKKKLSVGLAVTDPFSDQQLNYFTQAPGYNLLSYSRRNTRNFKISAGYTIAKKKS